jgi:hypothetical protein
MGLYLKAQIVGVRKGIIAHANEVHGKFWIDVDRRFAESWHKQETLTETLKRDISYTNVVLSQLSDMVANFQEKGCPFISAVETMKNVEERMDKIEGKTESIDNLEKRLKERDKAPRPKPRRPGLPGQAQGWGG